MYTLKKKDEDSSFEIITVGQDQRLKNISSEIENVDNFNYYLNKLISTKCYEQKEKFFQTYVQEEDSIEKNREKLFKSKEN